MKVKWILCKNELPQNYNDVWVTTIDNNTPKTIKAFYDILNHIWYYSPGWEIIQTEVVAWASEEIPDPYGCREEEING